MVEEKRRCSSFPPFHSATLEPFVYILYTIPLVVEGLEVHSFGEALILQVASRNTSLKASGKRWKPTRTFSTVTVSKRSCWKIKSLLFI